MTLAYSFCIALIAVSYVWQYNATFLATYTESAIRRISLAEKLRRLPLSFFGRRDLADLTNVIMGDAEALEKCAEILRSYSVNAVNSLK